MEDIVWTAPEYHYYQKDARWNGVLAIGTIALALLALWQGNFLFAVFLVIAGFLIFSWGRRAPQTLKFTLTPSEIRIGDKRSYRYDKCEGFSIVQAPGHPPELALKITGRIHQWLRVIIPPEQGEAIHRLLSDRISEVEYQESLSDRISRFLRF